MLPRSNPSHQATHQPGGTKAALSQSLLALLYMSQDVLLLCVPIFLRVSLFLSIPLCLFLHLSLALPLSHWWFVFLLWDLGYHSVRAHCSALIHSRGWAPGARMGDCGCSLLSLLPLSPPTPHHPTPCSLPCDDVMAFICSGVTHWFPLRVTHSISPSSTPH